MIANWFFSQCRPPGAVTNVTAAVMVLMATNGKIPKDRSWKQAKMMMAKVDAFLDALINYDKEHIHSDVIKVDLTGNIISMQTFTHNLNNFSFNFVGNSTVFK